MVPIYLTSKTTSNSSHERLKPDQQACNRPGPMVGMCQKQDSGAAAKH
jgi:hypothetical protein